MHFSFPFLFLGFGASLFTSGAYICTNTELLYAYVYVFMDSHFMDYLNQNPCTCTTLNANAALCTSMLMLYIYNAILMSGQYHTGV